jgi:teichuronic acid exporter
MGITEREPEEGSVSNQPADQPPAQRLRSVYFWAMSGTFAAQGALWVLSLLVMRVLQPGDYGLVGIIGVFFGFCRTVQDAGLGAAIVQTPNLNRRLLNATFWFFIAVSIVLTVGGIVGAPFLGRAKGEARLPAVMSTLAFTFIILAIRAVPMALLTRKLEFRKRSMAEIYSAVLGSVITVILAYTGHGVWSLVFGNMINDVLLTSLCCFHAHWRPGLDCDWQGLKQLLRFGLPVTGSILLWQFYIDSDFLMIGLLLGPQQLGFYTLAWQFGMVPADRLSTVLNKANLPVFSSLQNDPEGVRRHWNRLVSMVSWVAFPVAAGIALVGGGFLHVCLPAKWDGAVPILPALSILGGMRSISVILPSVLMALGKPAKLFLTNIAGSIVYPIAFAIAAHFGGPVAVAWAWVVIQPLMYLGVIYLSLPLTSLRLRDYFRPMEAPFVTTLVMAAAVWSTGKILLLPPLLELILQVAVGVIIYVGLGGLWLKKTDQLSLDRIGLRHAI